MTDAGDAPAATRSTTWSGATATATSRASRFDDQGRLWAAEFGDKGADELNLVRPGKNYGWPDVEGSDGKGGYADPLAEWPVDQCSPSGIAVAAGRAWLGALQGECVWSVVLDGPDAGKTAAALRRPVRPDPLGRARPRRLAVGDHLQPRRPHRPAARRRPDPAGHPVTVADGTGRRYRGQHVRCSRSHRLPSSVVRHRRLARLRGAGRRAGPGVQGDPGPGRLPAPPLRVDQGRRAPGGGVPAGQPGRRDRRLRPQGRREADRRRPGPGRRRSSRSWTATWRRRSPRSRRSPPSENGLVQLAIVGLSDDATGFDTQSFDAVKQLRADLEDAVTGDLQYGVTGNAAAGYDQQESGNKALLIVGLATILLILVLLALIFRSVLICLMPIIVVGPRVPGRHRADRHGQRDLRPQGEPGHRDDPVRRPLRHRHRLHPVLPVPLPRTAPRGRGEAARGGARARARRRGDRLRRRCGDRGVHGAGAVLARDLPLDRAGAGDRGGGHPAGRAHAGARRRDGARPGALLAVEEVPRRARGRPLRRRRRVAGPPPGPLRARLRRRAGAADARGAVVQPDLRPRRPAAPRAPRSRPWP